MAEKKVGTLIREARTEAGLTQEKLADKAGLKLTAAMISECERGIADLTSAQLKKIAVVCGVTQSSLLNAPKNIKTAEKKTAAEKTSEKKTAVKTTEKKTAAEKTSEKKTAAGKKAAEKKTTDEKKTASKSAKKTTASSAKASSGTSAAAKTAAKTQASKSSASTSTVKVTAAEKKMLEAYRDASAELRKTALKVLKGEYSDEKLDALDASGSSIVSSLGDGLGGVIGDVLSGFLGGKS